MLLLLAMCFNYDIAVAQELDNKMDSLIGGMELTIDISNMTDTVGRFMVMVGDEIFYPEVKNSVMIIQKSMKEPRKTFFAFYPAQKIKENPGKELNYIAAAVSDNIDFLGLPGKYKILVQGTVDKSEIINPSPHQKKYAALVKLNKNFDTKMMTEQAPLIEKIKITQNAQTRDSLISIYYKNYREQYPKYYQDTILGFVKHNPDEPASVLELEQYSYKNDKSLTILSILYNNLTERLKILPTAKRIYNAIDEEHFADSLIGRQAPLFVQNDPLGKLISLSDFKGNVTLLEFWASWCGPCRASNPGIVKIYQKYRDRGLRILGVSLDSKKDQWIKAIKEDGLAWTHVSDLKEFDNAAAALFHVKSIPSNFLIDKSGKVIATDLNEQELDEQLEKLLK